MNDLGWSWLLTPALLILTTFFSTTTLALRHAAWPKLQEAFQDRSHPERSDILRRRLPRLVCSTAVLSLLANLALMLCVINCYTSSSSSAEPRSSILPMIKALILSAALLSIFSVAIPHAWARYAGTPLLVGCYPILRFLEWFTRPITYVLHLIDLLVRRLAGAATDGLNGSTEDRQQDLLNAVEEGEKGGLVDKEEREMIASVLEFRDTTIGEIMTPRTDVVGIDADAKLPEAVETVIQQGHSRYPVYEGSIDKIIGMLYAKDLLHDLNNPDRAVGIRHRLRKPYFVPESKTVRDLLHDFQNQKVHMAIVLDEYGGTAGAVTIEDILEELVGEIVDEYEGPQIEPVRRIGDSTLEVDARCHVDQINDEFDLQIPEDDDYETVGGFAFTALGRIPRPGETFRHGNLMFTVIDVEQRRINRLRIDILPEPEQPSTEKQAK